MLVYILEFCSLPVYAISQPYIRIGLIKLLNSFTSARFEYIFLSDGVLIIAYLITGLYIMPDSHALKCWFIY